MWLFAFLIFALNPDLHASDTFDRSVVIYPLGDSITRGIDDVGYRQFLYNMLAQQDVSAHFIGSLSNGPANFLEPRHDGHNGRTINYIERNIATWLGNSSPDLILLMAGSNDIEAWFAPDVKGMPARMGKLLDRIVALRPDALLLVSEITAIDNDKYDAQAVSFNKALKDLVTARANPRLIFVPMHDVVARSELVRLDHPNPEGNRKIALRWLDYINKYYFLKTTH
jgi:lysophospholipase L1-like esterase